MIVNRQMRSALHGVGQPRTRFRGRFRIQGVIEENEDWFTRSSTWIKRSPLILGGSGFAFVLLNRLAYGGAVGLDFGTAASRSDVLCLVTSSILVLTGLNWISIQQRELTTLDLVGEEMEYLNRKLNDPLLQELRWCCSALADGTTMDTLMIFHKNQGVFCKGICRKNMDAVDDIKPGEIIKTSISTGKAVYIPKLKVYPGSFEFFQYLPKGTQSVIVQPFSSDGALVISSATDRAFGKLDQAWISVICEKLNSMRATISKLRFDVLAPYVKHSSSNSAFRTLSRNAFIDFPPPRGRSTSLSWCTAVSQETASLTTDQDSESVRVRFAPSPTGNLHVGGARTALFNWLYVKNKSGKMILRIEDTDQSRSTVESEEAVLRDLKWLGIDWDEGPGVEGEFGPYHQSERTQIYKSYVEKLVEQNFAYPCFSTEEELEKMKLEAEEKKLPPIYRGKWANASPEEVQEMMESGHPYCYRFRVPKDQLVRIRDCIRGDVTWNTDTLGDFVIMRSNGMPVYNFCVAVDDALMKITHVIRAEEHLANTLRQVLVYRALGFQEPVFGHVSLILAPDKSKLSKRHGATSVGEFREQGYLPSAMINYLSLLGWNDGTEQEVFTVDELQEKFCLERITKSAAVFDKEKLSWMNGQHLRALPLEQARAFLCEVWIRDGVLKDTSGPFIDAAVHLAQDSIELLNNATKRLTSLFAHPMVETLSSDAAKPFIEDDIIEVFEVILKDYESGVLQQAIEEDSIGALIKTTGKKLKRRGKRIFMPYRIAITGLMEGPEVSKILKLLFFENGEILDRSNFVPLSTRMETLKQWTENQST